MNIENRYYNAKGDLAEDVDAALAGFQEVVSMEDEKGEWGFKVLSPGLLHTPLCTHSLASRPSRLTTRSAGSCVYLARESWRAHMGGSRTARLSHCACAGV